MQASMFADLGPVKPDVKPESGEFWSYGGRVSPSRARRREKRAAERQLFATPGKTFAEKAKNAEAAAENTAAENAAAKEVVAGNVASPKGYVEEAAAMKAAESNFKNTAALNEMTATKADAVMEKAEIGASMKAGKIEFVENGKLALNSAAETKCDHHCDTETASTSNRLLSQEQSCWNCRAAFTPAHQCDREPISEASLAPKPSDPTVGNVDLPPLPLCHYCCHRGSGEHPVHYYPQCLCLEKKCDCQCYCTQEQLNHRKKLFPNFYLDMVSVDPKDWMMAKATAEARVAKQNGHRPCGSDNCVTPFS